MSKISEKNYGTDIVCGYHIDSVDNRMRALEWIARVILREDIDVHTIEMEDYLSYHDGTQTKVIHRIDTAASFVNEYVNSGYKGVGISCVLDTVSLELGINLNTQKVVLALSAADASHFEYIESCLGLS